MRDLFLTAVAALAALSTAPAGAALVTNGNFETGDLTGWTPFGDQDAVGVDDASEHGGTYGAFGGPATPAGFSQAIATTAGQNYKVTFWLQAERGGYITSKPNSFSATFGGVSLLSLVNTNPFNFTEYSYDIVATAASSDLVFSFMNYYSYFDLDDVSIVAEVPPPAVPEPATWGMFLGGMALVRMMRRRLNS